jgi:hypothetical protein
MGVVWRQVAAEIPCHENSHVGVGVMRPRHAFEVTFNQVTGIKDGKAARSAELGHKKTFIINGFRKHHHARQSKITGPQQGDNSRLSGR